MESEQVNSDSWDSTKTIKVNYEYIFRCGIRWECS
jgi:hypothetical protein